MRERILIRNLDDEGLLEAFLVSAIVVILLVRFYLYLTGFPQVGGKGLHIAHLLWGGLLMVAGIITFFNYLTRAAHRLAAIICGAGFGLFMDEIGKFLTSNNNYFFRPATAIIYIVFVLLYLVLRLTQRERNITDREYLVNGLQMFREALVLGCDEVYVMRARRYLERMRDPGPHAQAVLTLLKEVPCTAEQVGRLERWRRSLHRHYHRLVESHAFARAVVGFFLVQSAVTLGIAFVATLSVNGFLVPPASLSAFQVVEKEADLVFALVAAGLTLLGATIIAASRRAAYHMFKLAMLVSILLTQIFAFYDIQFWALPDLAFNVAGLGLINELLDQERHHSAESGSATGERAAASAAGEAVRQIWK